MLLVLLIRGKLVQHVRMLALVHLLIVILLMIAPTLNVIIALMVNVSQLMAQEGVQHAKNA